MTGRIRTIKPEWLEDEGLLRAGSDARVLSLSLVLLADDYGNGRCIPAVLAAQVFPFEPEPSRSFREALARLSEMGFVHLYEVRGQSYFSIRNWSKHQKVDHPSKPRVPGPNSEEKPVTSENHATSSRDSRETLDSDPDPIRSDQDHERERARAAPPPTNARPPAPAPIRSTGPTVRWDLGHTSKLFSEMRKSAGYGPYQQKQNDYYRLQELTDLATSEAAERGTTPEQVLRWIFAAWFASNDKFALDARFSFATLTDPGTWLASHDAAQRKARVTEVFSAAAPEIDGLEELGRRTRESLGGMQ